MVPVRDAEWSNLTKEQRRNHPWVKAGQISSLQSSKKGSRNQKYAFELLKLKVNYLDWEYHYLINKNWQIDIAAPRRNIFVEWDGRPHRKPLFGIKHLRNIQNRDRIKDRIITKEIRGTMIRIEDNGKFNPVFVDDITDEIVDLIENKKLKNKTYHI